MGLAGYMPDTDWDEGRLLKAFLTYMAEQFHRHPENWKHGLRSPNFQLLGLDQDSMEFVAAFYKWHMLEFVGEAVAKNYNRLGSKRGMVIAGGSALALELNTRLYEMTNGDLVFGPGADDSGLALGCAAFAYFLGNNRWPRVHTASLNELQTDLPAVGPQTPKEIAKLLSKNEVVALVRGKAELGPRALGYRSLLANASDSNNLKRVSQEIKNREFYRPLAPIVTEEEFDRFFEGPRGNYMQYRVLCKPETEQTLPAIVHKDKSARPQVVSALRDPWMHELLVEYGKLTGHQCLINTSLNANNKPICNTIADVIEDMQNKNVVIACLPTKAWIPASLKLL
jgi:carbamoyltransferase